jgi:hypothetical protein
MMYELEWASDETLSVIADVESDAKQHPYINNLSVGMPWEKEYDRFSRDQGVYRYKIHSWVRQPCANRLCREGGYPIDREIHLEDILRDMVVTGETQRALQIMLCPGMESNTRRCANSLEIRLTVKYKKGLEAA